MPAMKVHHFARGFWEHEPPSLTLACKRLCPLAPKLTSTATTNTTGINNFDLKSFIRPETSTTKPASSDYHKKESSHQVEAQPGGTRWNPTQEQIRILEMLYRGGMRTPNTQQIEQITVQLGKYGKIEGKNVFYWFQNHKARERQKQKRNTTLNSPMSPSSPIFSTTTSLLLSPVGGLEEEFDCTPYKRKCRSWAFDHCLEEDNKSYSTEGEEGEEEEEQGEDRTLKLFPLHPEGRSSRD